MDFSFKDLCTAPSPISMLPSDVKPTSRSMLVSPSRQRDDGIEPFFSSSHSPHHRQWHRSPTHYLRHLGYRPASMAILDRLPCAALTLHGSSVGCCGLGFCILRSTSAYTSKRCLAIVGTDLVVHSNNIQLHWNQLRVSARERDVFQ